MRSRWEEAVPLAMKMATEQGRMKFTRPLFRFSATPPPPTSPARSPSPSFSSCWALNRPFSVLREVFLYDKYRSKALSVFLAHRGAMHPVTAGLVAKDLQVDASNTSSL